MYSLRILAAIFIMLPSLLLCSCNRSSPADDEREISEIRPPAASEEVTVSSPDKTAEEAALPFQRMNEPVSHKANGEYVYDIYADDTLEGTVSITKYLGDETEVNVPAEIDGARVASIGLDAVSFIGAFQNCGGVVSVVIPEGIEFINDNAFCGCHALESVSIPASVSGIGNCAFDDCPRLTAVYFAGDAPDFGSYVFSYPAPTLYYPAAASGWSSVMTGLDKRSY